MNFRYKAITVIIASGILMTLFFLTYVRFADKSSTIQALEFDMDTITASDYTIEFQIKKEFYQSWNDERAEEDTDFSAIALKKHMQEKIQFLLSKHVDTFDDNLPPEEKKKRDKKNKKLGK